MYVNNEIGSVQDIEEIAREIKSVKNDIILHVDAVQHLANTESIQKNRY